MDSDERQRREEKARLLVTGLFSAVTFLTRIPLPRALHRDDALPWASAWFPIVGAFVGVASGAAFVFLQRSLGDLVAAVATVTVSIALTGAFHEDGLADSADALGGAFDRPRIFEILKDPRIGTYGAIALFLSLFWRVALLASLGYDAVWAWIAAHALARTAPVALMRFVPYATDTDASRSSTIRDVGDSQLAIAAAFAMGFVVLTVFRSPWATVMGLALHGAMTYGLGRYFTYRAGGLTGDFLGATEQAGEVLWLFMFAVAHHAWW